jgi:hypothetical protein
MASKTSWAEGAGVGFTWTTLINGSDMASLASGSAVLSSVADIANQTNLDMFMDVSVQLTIASATPSAGATIALYLAYLQADGTTYGSGEMASAGTITRAPAMVPITRQIQSTAATTLMSADFIGIQIAPGSFRVAIYNGTGLSFSATNGNNVVKYRTYNINLNA